jgi:hypothetical protein
MTRQATMAGSGKRKMKSGTMSRERMTAAMTISVTPMSIRPSLPQYRIELACSI